MTDTGKSKSYGNFRNPLGLAYRMLTSGRRAAWSALFREMLGKLTMPVDVLLAVAEAKKIRTAASNDRPLILIVGPPRSGTTLVYQALSYSLDVTYPNNLGALFPRSPITASRIAQKRRPEFQSFYGQTARFSGANDGFLIWNRWFGDDRYVPLTDLTESDWNNMREFFEAWTATHKKPFLNKNNRNVDCIALLAKHLPTSWFVVVRRDPQYVARSLIKARELVQGDKRAGWGLRSQEDHASEGPLGYVQDVCDQVQRNEEKLADQISRIESHRVVDVRYEGFCQNADACIDVIVESVPGLTRRSDAISFSSDFFQLSTSHKLSAEEEDIIAQRFPSAK